MSSDDAGPLRSFATRTERMGAARTFAVYPVGKKTLFPAAPTLRRKSMSSKKPVVIARARLQGGFRLI